jgi:hypothetical protein
MLFIVQNVIKNCIGIRPQEKRILLNVIPAISFLKE